MSAHYDAAQAVAAAVDAGRIHARIAALANIGGTAQGGVDRPAFSAAERDATDLFALWCAAAGLTVAYDSFGNLFASSDGNRPGTIVSAAGSHLDTVPDGGKFDGVLGCVGALAAVEAMHAAGVAPPVPLEVVVWRCEEPYRFMQGRVGSLVYAGKMSPDDLTPRGTPFDLPAWLASEQDRPQRAAGRTLGSILELHIEQGRRLEDAATQIGIVTAVSGTTRQRLTVRGAADHSGATPMELRHDALCAAAELVLAAERAARAEPLPESVATAAILTATPGAMNVVPGGADVWLDIRGTDAASVQRMVESIAAEAAHIARRRGVSITTETLTRATPVSLDAALVQTVASAAQSLGYTAMHMASGAGHDAQSVADRTRAGMIFVPSRGGISHSPNEWTDPDDLVRGVRVLAATWVEHTLRQSAG